MPESYANVYDPLETLAYVAAKTERVKLGTSIIDALFHVPAILARRFATLDRLSGGRVIAGLGQGYSPEEFAAANVPMSRRGAGFEEFIEAMRAAWGPDPVYFSGRFYEIPEPRSTPSPCRRVAHPFSSRPCGNLLSSAPAASA
jgi:alkanesulfonate monooxygenase SsuD/methylene tetrahydromethanopterin reductase-like flavin-dependent oxidoreductase (luciferase family)